MPLVTAAELVTAAAARRTGIPAFNVMTLEHVEGVVAGAGAAGRPVVVQVSQNAVRYHGGDPRPLAAAAVAAAGAADVPVALHLDHVDDPALLRATADLGFSSVMYDGSRLPYAENLAETARAAAWAHERGLSLEAELGEVGGKDGAHAPGVRTDPEEAARFVAATGVDSLAVAVGSSHAMTSRTAALDLELVGRLREAAGVPLVLHGSSGVPDEVLAAAVAAGMVKINVGTLLNVVFTAAVREALADGSVVDPRRYLARGRDAVAEQVTRTLLLLAP